MGKIGQGEKAPAGIYYNPNQQRQIHAVAKKEAQVVRPLLCPARSPWKGPAAQAEAAAVPILHQLVRPVVITDSEWARR